MKTEIERCHREQKRCRDNMDEFPNERHLAMLGAQDWIKQEILLTTMQPSYEKFLSSKRLLAPNVGFAVHERDLNPMLKPFQKKIVTWALRRGKAAVFAHTGLGKGPIGLEWCRHVHLHTDAPVLLSAPLAVSQQFKRESLKFGIDVNLCRSQAEVVNGINITNYEMLQHFDLSAFAGVALDESGCIKDWSSKTTKSLIAGLANTRYKLCSTATPSPNDHAELGTHAELLDVMTRAQMLAMFFEHDGGETSKWSLKGHAKKPFWKFVASWAVCLKLPSDLGDSDDGFVLLPLHIVEHIVPVDQSINTEGMLFRCPDMSATGLHKEMRLTANDRAAMVANLVSEKPDEPWLLWCNTNYETDAVKAVIPHAVEVKGSDSVDKKERVLNGFSTGEVKILLSKPTICGYGMNFQHCANMAFVGLGYSFEQVFQSIRRCWRYGQSREVYAHMVIAETEGEVLQAIRRKEAQYEELQSEMNAAMRVEQLGGVHQATRYDHNMPMAIPDWLIEGGY